ncbi:MAG: phosphotransferase [Actinomycetota bacterium]
MIPLPPPDRVLPGVRVALRGDTIAELFDRSLTASSVRSCAPYYVKYKPERYCRVQYELEIIDWDRGTTVRTTAHAALCPQARAQKLASRLRVTPSTPGIAYIPELSAIAQLWPGDLGLPGLAEASTSESMLSRFSQALPARVGTHLGRCEIEVVRYKAGKRAVLKYRVDGTHAGYVFGKLRKDGGRSLLRVADALSRAHIPTPEPLTWFPDLGMMVQAEGAGVRLSDLRGAAAYERWMPPVAEAVAQLHDTAIESLPRYSLKAQVEELMDAAITVGYLVPPLASQAATLARRLAPMLAAIDGRASTVHGSFHDDQVLVDESGVTFVDMDQAMQADPLVDVGHFLSYLSAECALEARSRFLTAYEAACGQRRDDHLVFEAACLLRWATLPFRELRPDWPRAVERRVQCAAERLKTYQGIRPARSSGTIP